MDAIVIMAIASSLQPRDVRNFCLAFAAASSALCHPAALADWIRARRLPRALEVAASLPGPSDSVTSVVRRILSSSAADPKDAARALLRAVRAGRRELVDMLIAAGARDGDAGWILQASLGGGKSITVDHDYCFEAVYLRAAPPSGWTDFALGNALYIAIRRMESSGLARPHDILRAAGVTLWSERQPPGIDP